MNLGAKYGTLKSVSFMKLSQQETQLGAVLRATVDVVSKLAGVL